MPLRIKRVYEPADKSDGVRILVDRLWPRGVKKTEIDLWIKDVAPSHALRKWFRHEPRKWGEFRSRYRKELATKKEVLVELRAAVKGRPATLLYGTKDETHNQAMVLAEFLARARSRAARKTKKVE
jgi:uncharacterized protein YeaO (DUF488 family)